MFVSCWNLTQLAAIPGGALPLWESVGMRRGFAPHFRQLDDLFAPLNLTMSTILFRSCWVPFRNPPFSACRRSFCPKIDQIYNFIQILLGPILNFEPRTPTDFYPECPPRGSNAAVNSNLADSDCARSYNKTLYRILKQGPGLFEDHFWSTEIHLSLVIRNQNTLACCHCYTPAQRSCWGGILVSLCPSVRPSRIPCPLCSAYSFGWIHLISISYQATSDGVSHVAFLAKFQNLNFLQFF